MVKKVIPLGTFDDLELALSRRRRGRPSSADPLIFRSVGLTAAQWDWLALWHSAENPTRQLQDLLDRACKFWPSGPGKFR